MSKSGVVELKSAPSQALQIALQTFEKQFSYPLSEAGSFSIEHGRDYSRFCQAMGPARSFIVEANGIVKAAIATSIRALETPQGCLQTAYICDLKINPRANSGRSLISAMNAAHDWCKPQAEVAYGVVMQGTAADPAKYSGRLGIPQFLPVGQITVLQIDLHSLAKAAWQADVSVSESTESISRDHFAQLAHGYFCLLGDPNLRSQTQPIWLTASGASGCLEDTRQAKRLIKADGNEILAAHLTNFAYKDFASACVMIGAAAQKAVVGNFQSMFVSFPSEDRDGIMRELSLRGINPLVAGATIYAHGLKEGQPWFIHSSEI